MNYDRDLIASVLENLMAGGGLQYSRDSVIEQARLLREADDKDAAGVHTAARAAEALAAEALAGREGIERDLNTGRRQAAVLLAINSGYKWDGKEWQAPSRAGGGEVGDEDWRDAMRYRWLRTTPNNLNPAIYAACNLLMRDGYLDDAIDAQIALHGAGARGGGDA